MNTILTFFYLTNANQSGRHVTKICIDTYGSVEYSVYGKCLSQKRQTVDRRFIDAFHDTCLFTYLLSIKATH